VGGQDYFTEPDLIAVVQNPIDLRRLEERTRRFTVLKVTPAAVLDYRHIAFHHHVLRARQLFDERAAGTVIEVGMADQQDLDVAETESEALHILLDHRHGTLEIAIDQNVPLRSRDQERGQVLASDVIDVRNDLVRRKGSRPVRILLCQQAG